MPQHPFVSSTFQSNKAFSPTSSVMRVRPGPTEGTGVPDPVKQSVDIRMETLLWNRDEPGHKINRNWVYANHVITSWTAQTGL